MFADRWSWIKLSESQCLINLPLMIGAGAKQNMDEALLNPHRHTHTDTYTAHTQKNTEGTFKLITQINFLETNLYPDHNHHLPT